MRLSRSNAEPAGKKSQTANLQPLLLSLWTLAFVICAPWRVSVEGLATAAAALRIRIPELKPLAVQAIVEIDVRAVEIGEARRIDEQLQSLALKRRVTGLQLVKRNAVLQARATARLDKNAQTFARSIVRLRQGADLCRGTG
jgi:hypothetical protein